MRTFDEGFASTMHARVSCCAADCHELRSSQQRVALNEMEAERQRLLVSAVSEGLDEAAKQRQKLLRTSAERSDGTVQTTSERVRR